MASIGGPVIYQDITVSLLAATVETADATLASITVPADAVILDVVVSVTDMDDGATLTIDVGDSAGPETADDDRFIAALSGQAASVLHSNIDGGLTEWPIDYADLTVTGATVDIEATVKAVAATGVDGTLKLGVYYARR
jgi:hypothetical protein